MIRRLLFGLDREVAVTFDSPFSVDESVRRLANVVERGFFGTLFRQTAHGEVTPDQVRVERTIPLFVNDFKPVFTGCFEVRDGKVALVGTFGMKPSTIRFITFAVGFGLVWSCGAVLSIAARGWGDLPWWFPLAGIGMAMGIVAIAHLAFLLSYRDIEWLQERIRESFAGYVP